MQSALEKYLLVLGFVVVFTLLAKNLVRARHRPPVDGDPRHDVAAAVIGIRPMYAKLSAFAVSSFIVGVAGALWEGYVHLWLVGAAGPTWRGRSSCCSLSHHRRPGSILGQLLRRRLHRC